MGNEQRQMRFTTFCQMDFIPHPCCAPLLAVMSLLVIRRANVTRRRRNVLRSTPSDHLINALVILYPHLAQNFYRWNLAEPLRGHWIKEGIKELSSLLSDLFSKSQTCHFSQR